MAESALGSAPAAAVEPFYFGDPPLFGCLHPGGHPRRGVVFCHPFGHEYITLHRAARLLAAQISRTGLPTLRFDYSGTGDSAGQLGDARLEHWVDEIGRATDVLRARTGVERVSLVGVRLGAALALLAAAERDDVESLALWDPVVWGRTYLRQQERDHRRMLRVAHVTPGPRDKTVIERLGFRLGPGLEDDLRHLELDAVEPPPTARVLLLESLQAASAPLGARLRATGCNVTTRLDAVPHMWRWSEDITRVQLPHSHIRTLAAWIAEEAA